MTAVGRNIVGMAFSKRQDERLKVHLMENTLIRITNFVITEDPRKILSAFQINRAGSFFPKRKLLVCNILRHIYATNR